MAEPPPQPSVQLLTGLGLLGPQLDALQGGLREVSARLEKAEAVLPSVKADARSLQAVERRLDELLARVGLELERRADVERDLQQKVTSSLETQLQGMVRSIVEEKVKAELYVAVPRAASEELEAFRAEHRRALAEHGAALDAAKAATAALDARHERALAEQQQALDAAKAATAALDARHERALAEQQQALDAAKAATAALDARHGRALAEQQEALDAAKAATAALDARHERALGEQQSALDAAKARADQLEVACRDARLGEIWKELELVREERRGPRLEAPSKVLAKDIAAVDQVGMAFSAAMKADANSADLDAVDCRLRTVERFLHERLSGVPQGPAYRAPHRLARARSVDPAARAAVPACRGGRW